MEDTVEHQVDGLAERIIAEDAERRAQDLVSAHLSERPPQLRRAPTRGLRMLNAPHRTCSISRRSAPTGT